MKQFLIFTLLLLTLGVRAQDIPPRPNPPRLVNDFAHVMSPDQVDALEKKLVAYDDSTSTQIVVVTVESLNGASIDDYALKILREWGVGNKKTNNGIVLLAAIKDHKVRIETGYGMEGAIPDILAKTIIDRELAPSFRSGNYYRGFDKAVDAIVQAAAGKYKAPEGYRGQGKGGGGSILGLIVIFIIILFLLSRIGGGKGGGGMMSRSGILPWLVVNSLLNSGRGSGGGWGGDSGGGGFGGFGGGSGGGGGASGSW